MKAHALQHWPPSGNQTRRWNDKLSGLANQSKTMAMTSGSILMVVAPSGAGKSSLVNGLLERDPSIVLSISCTTREPRPGEVDARHYRFVSQDAFKAMRDNNELLEWAEVHGNFYGTPRDGIEAATRSGHDVLLEIDWQGARQIKKHYPDAIGIFILPPSIEALEIRLKNRGQDAPQVITKRLLAAGGEMSHASECQYVIINQEFSTALSQLSSIVEAARLRYPAQATRHAELFSQLGISSTES
jgi:guanylate kinase